MTVPAGPALRVEATAQARHDTGPRLSCRHLIRHPASFLSPSCLRLRATHSRQRAWEQARPLRIRLTPAPTPTRTVAIAHPRECFTACAHHCFCRWTSFVFPPFTLFFLPILLLPPTVAATSRPTLVDAGTGRVGLAPGLSPFMPPRRTRWCLPHLGYLGDEESRFEILDNQGP
jgi:hypothetical protein